MSFLSIEQKKILRPCLFLFAALSLVGLNIVSFAYQNQITTALLGDGIDYDTPEENQARSEGEKLAKDIAGEGIVLLKNSHNSLPLTKKTLNVFGFGGSDFGFIHQGGGSSRTSSYHQISLYQSLMDNDIDINQDLAKSYNLLKYRRNENSTDPSVFYRLYEPEQSFYSSSLWSDAVAYSQNAMVVISRAAIEKTDLPKRQYDKFGNVVSDRHYCQLSRDEEWLLEQVEARFSNVIVLLNAGNPIESGFIENDSVASALSISYPGNTGLESLGKVLLGELSPSGHLTDTIPYDFSTNPTFPNAGDTGAHDYQNHGNYIDYAEGVYVGYRYYETASQEGVFDAVSNGFGTGYDGVVQFPFGFGLSYSSFSWSIESLSYGNGNSFYPWNAATLFTGEENVQLRLWVENAGKRGASDVVECYASLPYFPSGIEKSSLILCAFAKTGLLKPGEGEEITLRFPLSSLASFDCYDRNNDGFMGYELEKGLYQISLRSDVHNPHPLAPSSLACPSFRLAQNRRYEKDPVTAAPVGNLFTTYTNSVSGASSAIAESESPLSYSLDGFDAGQGIIYLSRSSFSATFPQTTPVRSMDEAMYSENYLTHSPVVFPADSMPETSEDAGLSLKDLLGVSYSDPRWGALVGQLSVDDLKNLSLNAGFGTPKIDIIGKPRCLDLDGTSGLNTTIYSSLSSHATSYPCATLLAQSWNWRLAYEYGCAVGKEAEALGVNGWYAPGGNLHRSPFGGRDFEYFSEDPFLAGTFSSYICQGAQENGVYCYVKHFAADDSETGQNSQYHWLSEQAFRELYAKPFEMAVKNGALGVMVSKNRVGSVRATGSDALLTKMLRGEWGFQGSIISDYYVGGVTNDADESLRAGVDLMLNGAANVTLRDDRSPTVVIALQRAAKNALYSYSQAQYLRNVSQGLDLSRITGAKNDVRPYWLFGLLGIDILSLSGLALALFFSRRAKKRL